MLYSIIKQYFVDTLTNINQVEVLEHKNVTSMVDGDGTW